MVYYLKYRPQTISELDSKELRERLYSVLSTSSVPHAFLFTGPKGLGKTSTARIVAKAVNCEKLKVENGKLKMEKKKNSQLSTLNSQLEPCNQCSQCVSITNGSNLDVLEIDGASNRGIDEIRDLREKIRLSPVAARKKVYIIDEVHMLTTDAFNALLKTLEEPPDHAMFIFCTTELFKVPQTIVSRCFHVSFHVATNEELVNSFQRIANGEGLKIEKDVFSEIAKLSDGSFRDGAKILEELVLRSEGNKITKELLEEKYFVLSIKYYVEEMFELLTKKDAKLGLELVSKIVEQGIDMKYFLEQVIEKLHAQLLAQAGVEEFKIQNSKFKIEDIKKLVELFSKAHQELKYAVLPQLPLEIAIIEWSLEDVLSDKSRSVVSQSVQTDKQKTDSRNIWQELINGVKIHNHSLAGVLRGCSLKSLDNDSLVIETSFQFHKERLSDEKARIILEKVVEDITGKKVGVLVELKK